MLVALAVLVVMRKHMVGVGGGAWAAGARRWTRVFAVRHGPWVDASVRGEAWAVGVASGCDDMGRVKVWRGLIICRECTWVSQAVAMTWVV